MVLAWTDVEIGTQAGQIGKSMICGVDSMTNVGRHILFALRLHRSAWTWTFVYETVRYAIRIRGYGYIVLGLTVAHYTIFVTHKQCVSSTALYFQSSNQPELVHLNRI